MTKEQSSKIVASTIKIYKESNDESINYGGYWHDDFYLKAPGASNYLELLFWENN
jgi:hypothetical protein